jgi:hypothetical protein
VKYSALLLCWALLAFGFLRPAPVHAQAVDTEAAIVTLPPLTVIGLIDNPATGQSTLQGEIIGRLPKGNGSVNELLRLLPNIQLGEKANLSTSGGEILPPAISVAGGKIYQNNLLIDGIGNNSLLDPAAASENLVTDVAGHPQERLFGTDLIARIIVFDSNVPARYGDFSGGVIAVETRDPVLQLAGSLAWRTTRSQWTRFHIAAEDRATFIAGRRIDLQPRFEKDNYRASLDLPLTDRMGLLVSYRHLTSRIPLAHFDGVQVQQRRQREYFLKHVWDVSSADRLTVTLSGTPYEEDRFLRNVKNSDYRVELGGQSLQARWQHLTTAGELQLDAAWRHSRNRRSGPQHLRVWAVTDSKDWGRLLDAEASVEGGFGVIDKEQKSYTLQGEFVFVPLYGRGFSQEWTLGGVIARTEASFARPTPTYVYRTSRLSADIRCADNTFDCQEGEQFFTERQVYPAATGTASIDQWALYADNRLRYRRLDLRPGLRLSYDDLMGNANLAPRLAIGYDLFASGHTLLIAGLNRYYSSALPTDKLREARRPFRTENRTSYNNRPLEWEAGAIHGPNATRFTELKTPYADELTLGLDQALGGGRFSLKYVQRRGRDEFARSYSPMQPDGLRYYTLNNHGRSDRHSYRATWERSWLRHFLSLNTTWQQTTTSNEGYDTVLDGEDLDSRIWYRGELLHKTALPGKDYNRPLLANLIWSVRLPLGLTFSNVTRYRGGYRAIEASGELRALPGGERRLDPLTGEELFEVFEVYEESRYRDALLFDWSLQWQSPAWRRQNLLFGVEIDNVFNSRARTGGAAQAFEMGRQIWAGVEYRF